MTFYFCLRDVVDAVLFGIWEVLLLAPPPSPLFDGCPSIVGGSTFWWNSFTTLPTTHKKNIYWLKTSGFRGKSSIPTANTQFQWCWQNNSINYPINENDWQLCSVYKGSKSLYIAIGFLYRIKITSIHFN